MRDTIYAPYQYHMIVAYVINGEYMNNWYPHQYHMTDKFHDTENIWT